MLPVDRLITVKSAECLSCYHCIAACPAEGALKMSAPGSRKIPAWAVAAAMAVLFVGVVSWARWTGHWHADVPDWVYSRLIPKAREFSHP
jgi:ferredoxin